MTSENAQVLVPGRLWLGARGARAIGPALVELLDAAAHEVIIVAYRLTVAVPQFMRALEQALSRGCYVRLVINLSTLVDVDDQYVGSLLRDYSTLSAWDFREDSGASLNYALHAKVFVVDRSTAIVGSANVSRNGMFENHEMSLLVTGEAASAVAAACDSLIDHGLREGVLEPRPSG